MKSLKMIMATILIFISGLVVSYIISSIIINTFMLNNLVISLIMATISVYWFCILVLVLAEVLDTYYVHLYYNNNKKK